MAWLKLFDFKSSHCMAHIAGIFPMMSCYSSGFGSRPSREQQRTRCTGFIQLRSWTREAYETRTPLRSLNAPNFSSLRMVEVCIMRTFLELLNRTQFLFLVVVSSLLVLVCCCCCLRPSIQCFVVCSGGRQSKHSLFA